MIKIIIVGPTGSGKTIIARQIKAMLEANTMFSNKKVQLQDEIRPRQKIKIAEDSDIFITTTQTSVFIGADK